MNRQVLIWGYFALFQGIVMIMEDTHNAGAWERLIPIGVFLFSVARSILAFKDEQD